MIKISFFKDDRTYGKYVSSPKRPSAILVPQGKYTHLVYGLQIVPETVETEMHSSMPEHYEGSLIEISGSPDYGTIVTAVIRDRYTQSQVEAIVLNGSDTEEHAAEFTALQDWRKYAKEIAKEVLNLK